MQNLIQTNINFGGFYYSVHSDIIDSYIENTDYNWEDVDGIIVQLPLPKHIDPKNICIPK